jgi:hypothetical protein
MIPAWLVTPIALKAIAVIAVVIGVTAWWNIHNYNVRQAAIKEYKVKLEACADQTKVAVDANKSLQASMQSLIDKLNAQNDKITALQVAEKTARAARDSALEAALAKERALRVEINRLTVIANAPPVPQTTEVCDAAANLLRGYAAAR